MVFVMRTRDLPASKARRRLLGGLGALVARQAIGAGEHNGALVLGVHPYLTKTEILAHFSPLAELLAPVTGRPVSVRVGGSYAEHVRAIGQDAIDVAFMGPVPYVRMLEQYGPKPFLARFEVDHRPDLRGVIAVRADSALRTLGDLRGRRVAFGDPNSTMGFVVPAWTMAQAGVPLHALGGYRLMGSHPDVALGVLAGDFDAGALKSEVFDAYASRGLRILAESPPTPDHLFVTRADLPAALVVALRRTMLSLHETEAGRRALLAMHAGLTRLVPGEAADYDGLRAMMRALGGEMTRGE